jgi:GTP-binding protein HflX
VGDEKGIFIPALKPLGRRSLRGVRCIHTHLKNEPLTQDDLTDLALLRLDIMAAIGVREEGLPGNIYTAHLLPVNPEGMSYEVQPSVPFHRFDIDMEEFIVALEAEMGRGVTSGRGPYS